MITKLKNKLSKDKHLKELIKGSSSAFLLKIIGMSLSYISLLYITNKYGANVFGVLTLSITILSIFTLIPSFGMANALVKIIGELYSHKKYSEIKYILKIIFLLTTFLSALFIFLFYVSSDFIAKEILDKIYMSKYLKIITISVLFNTMIVIVSSTFQGMKKTKKFMIFQTLLLQFIFLLLLILNNNVINYNYNVVELYVASTVFSAVIALIYLYINVNSLNDISNNKIRKYNLTKILKLSVPMLLGSSFTMIMGWTDIVMLGIYKTEEDVGIYSAVLRIAGLISISLTAINAIATPKFIEFYSKKDMIGLEKIVKQSTKIIFFTSLPIVIIYIVFPSVVMNLFGSEFIIGASVLVIISLGQFINAMSGSVGYILQMTDNQKIFQNIIILASIINVILNYMLIPIYGMDGAAVASTISMMFWNLAFIYYIKKKLNFWTFYIPNFKIKRKNK